MFSGRRGGGGGEGLLSKLFQLHAGPSRDLQTALRLDSNGGRPNLALLTMTMTLLVTPLKMIFQ